MKIPKKYKEMVRSIEVAPPPRNAHGHWHRVRGIHLTGEQFSHASPDKRRMWRKLEADVLRRLQASKNRYDQYKKMMQERGEWVE